MLTALLSQKDLVGCIVLYMALADQEPNWQVNFLFRRIASFLTWTLSPAKSSKKPQCTRDMDD
jgi:hypothetical protein